MEIFDRYYPDESQDENKNTNNSFAGDDDVSTILPDLVDIQAGGVNMGQELFSIFDVVDTYKSNFLQIYFNCRINYYCL